MKILKFGGKVGHQIAKFDISLNLYNCCDRARHALGQAQTLQWKVRPMPELWNYCA
jgi:hypothetical protein